jgi:hypothetical protein
MVRLSLPAILLIAPRVEDVMVPSLLADVMKDIRRERQYWSQPFHGKPSICKV